MRLKVFAVIDTNVLVSSIISQSGYPYEILSLINSNNIIPLYDERIVREYLTVFHYDKLKLPNERIKDMMNLLAQKGIAVNDIETTKMILKDKDDVPFFEVKESSSEFSSYLVTGNLKHYPDDRYIITPKELILIMEQLERFIKINDFSYEQNIQSLIETNLNTGKYESGKNLIEYVQSDFQSASDLENEGEEEEYER